MIALVFAVVGGGGAVGAAKRVAVEGANGDEDNTSFRQLGGEDDGEDDDNEVIVEYSLVTKPAYPADDSTAGISWAWIQSRSLHLAVRCQ